MISPHSSHNLPPEPYSDAYLREQYETYRDRGPEAPMGPEDLPLSPPRKLHYIKRNAAHYLAAHPSDFDTGNEVVDQISAIECWRLRQGIGFESWGHHLTKTSAYGNVSPNHDAIALLRYLYSWHLATYENGSWHAPFSGDVLNLTVQNMAAAVNLAEDRVVKASNVLKEAGIFTRTMKGFRSKAGNPSQTPEIWLEPVPIAQMTHVVAVRPTEYSGFEAALDQGSDATQALAQRDGLDQESEHGSAPMPEGAHPPADSLELLPFDAGPFVATYLGEAAGLNPAVEADKAARLFYARYRAYARLSPALAESLEWAEEEVYYSVYNRVVDRVEASVIGRYDEKRSGGSEVQGALLGALYLLGKTARSEGRAQMSQKRLNAVSQLVAKYKRVWMAVRLAPGLNVHVAELQHFFDDATGDPTHSYYRIGKTLYGEVEKALRKKLHRDALLEDCDGWARALLTEAVKAVYSGSAANSPPSGLREAFWDKRAFLEPCLALIMHRVGLPTVRSEWTPASTHAG